MSRTLVSSGASETHACGVRLGQAARAGDILLLEGALGTGKTVLVQGIAEGLGATDVVVSPTFVLVRHHRGRLPLTHADLYRTESQGEVDALGLLDLAVEGVLAVEWADRADWSDAETRARVVFAPGCAEDERSLTIETVGADHLAVAFKP